MGRARSRLADVATSPEFTRQRRSGGGGVHGPKTRQPVDLGLGLDCREGRGSQWREAPEVTEQERACWPKSEGLPETDLIFLPFRPLRAPLAHRDAHYLAGCLVKSWGQVRTYQAR